MLSTNTKTGFKIGGVVGIIILLLGIAIIFGLYQMSKVSQEIIWISEEYSPLHEILNEIRKNQLNQSVSFEKIVSSGGNEIDIHNAKEQFWYNGGVIDSDISKAKTLVQTGIELAESNEVTLGFQSIQLRIEGIQSQYLEYESSAREVFFAIDEGRFEESQYLLGQIEQKEVKLHNQIDSTTDYITELIDKSTSQIEQNESSMLLGQVIIITIVGGIAATLGFFISQINRDLQKEVKTKTNELQLANEKLKKLDQMKDEFIGIASHELKSPIQPIFGFAELAKSGDIDQNEAWDGVTELAKKLQDLANDVLDVSRIESERLILHKEKLWINEIISNIIAPIRLNLQNGVEIQQKLDEDIEIEFDRVRFEQVLRNLLSNAIKFTPKGVIRVETHANMENNTFQVFVSDSGKGIPEDILPKVFEKFVTKGSSYQNQSGTGLGLFLCKGIIEAHDGKIKAKNNKIGASFEFSIPLAEKVIEKSIIEN